MKKIFFVLLCKSFLLLGNLESNLEELQSSLQALRVVIPKKTPTIPPIISTINDLIAYNTADFAKGSIWNILASELQKASESDKHIICTAYVDCIYAAVKKMYMNIAVIKDPFFINKSDEEDFEKEIKKRNFDMFLEEYNYQFFFDTQKDLHNLVDQIIYKAMILLGNFSKDYFGTRFIDCFEGMKFINKYVDAEGVKKVNDCFVHLLEAFFEKIAFKVTFLVAPQTVLDDCRNFLFYDAISYDIRACLKSLKKMGPAFSDLADQLKKAIYRNLYIEGINNSIAPLRYVSMLCLLKEKYSFVAEKLGIDLSRIDLSFDMGQVLASGDRRTFIIEVIDRLKKVISSEVYNKNKIAYDSLKGGSKALEDIIKKDQEALHAIGRRFPRMVSEFEKFRAPLEKGCDLQPQGIWNTEGTCFLNADLQLFRLISCVTEVLVMFFLRTKFRTVYSTQEYRELIDNTLKFVGDYSFKNERELETSLQAVQEALEKIDPELKAVCDMLGRTHRVVEILFKEVTVDSAYIDATEQPTQLFNNSIGFVNNSLRVKQTFDFVALKEVENGNSNFKKLMVAQREGAYFVIAIARSIGIEAFKGEFPFHWPKVLVLSTTRFNPITKKYEKIDQVEASGIFSVAPGAEKVKFKMLLDLPQFGFPKNAPTYRLIGFSAKIKGHAISVVSRGAKWFTCSNATITDVTDVMAGAEKLGWVDYFDFGKKQKAVAEVLVYERV